MERGIHRDRHTPGRATGFVFFKLTWPSGEAKLNPPHCHHLATVFRFIRDRLQMVPPEEYPQAAARLDAEVRKGGGKVTRILLASWAGTEPIEVFFASAQSAWQLLPKEDDQRRWIPIDINDI